MKALLIGYSDIAKRRVLPALSSSGVENIDIASISATEVDWPGKRKPRHFRDYGRALLETDAEIVYISTINNLHAELAQKALERGLHVVIDKPACLGLEATRHIVELARRKQLCLAEATVYAYHPRIARIRQAFEEIGSQPSHIVSIFSFPPHRRENFRYRADLGGGAMWDLGPYAVTPGRTFFGAPSSEIVSRYVLTSGEVDTAFSLLAVYPGGRSVVGSFGYTTGYINRLDIIGPRITVTMDRAFSPLPNMPADVTIRTADQTVAITVPAADTFALFFADVFRSIAQGDYSRFADSMLSDAGEMDRLRRSAELAVKEPL
jgi:dTDP-3,4-didehydro-2,6-dideoxy-alpha-D-glucose 3-reductase